MLTAFLAPDLTPYQRRARVGQIIGRPYAVRYGERMIAASTDGDTLLITVECDKIARRRGAEIITRTVRAEVWVPPATGKFWTRSVSITSEPTAINSWNEDHRTVAEAAARREWRKLPSTTRPVTRHTYRLPAAV